MDFQSRNMCCGDVVKETLAECKVEDPSGNEIHCGSLQSSGNSDLLEVNDIKVNDILKGIKEEEGLCNVNNEPVCQALFQSRQFHSNYALLARKRRYLIDSEFMLIVQCPSCFDEFKGYSDRLLRLLDHILAKHPKCPNRTLKQVEKRYRPLIKLYRKRMEQWRNC